MGACAFDLTHYHELLEGAKTGGYQWAAFDHEPKARDLFLRHDVDLSLEAALAMARIEHGIGAQATYLLMTESFFYNLDSPTGRDAISELRGLGHAVGLHAVYPRAERDDRFDKVVAWHNPDPAFMSRPIDGAVNVMGEPYFKPGRYRSDSNQHWREGCPHEQLADGELEWVQLLIHPEIWVYDGATMRATMESMLDAKRTKWWDALAADRIDLS